MNMISSPSSVRAATNKRNTIREEAENLGKKPSDLSKELDSGSETTLRPDKQL